MIDETGRRTWALVALGVGLLSLPLLAHHSFGDFYLESDSIEVEGVVVEFQYRSPHAWLHVSGTDRPFADEKIYSAEWVSTSQLDRQGIDKNFFKPGDRVRIWGSPSRNPNETRLHLKRIRRPNGWEWRPRGAAPASEAPTAR